jgi:hypothetical protein
LTSRTAFHVFVACQWALLVGLGVAGIAWRITWSNTLLLAAERISVVGAVSAVATLVATIVVVHQAPQSKAHLLVRGALPVLAFGFVWAAIQYQVAWIAART